ncbi:MAG: hypothetical protein ABA06_02745 [Parcubacteria bacterium C7867-001]|nr:MAG: hypothetical protein ABA06_02745 [Parcubacteria bacterium C7867-001]
MKKNLLPYFLAFVLLVMVVFGLLFLSLSRSETDARNPFVSLVSELFPAAPQPVLSDFVEVVDGCGAEHEGSCVRVRGAPTSTAPVVMQLRTGIVLPVSSTTVTDTTGRTWYQISFSEWLRYPERIAGPWYVAADLVQPFFAVATEELPEPGVASTTKRILVDRSDQTLYAYDGAELFLETPISTGLDLTPTPRGLFVVYRKTPSRYMQGPLPGISNQYYDLPGVPWNLYFTNEGGAIHGAYWHTQFGKQWSHGCVNVPLETAKKLYEWTPLGTPVTVRD